ncbi:hypothetical protein BWD10_04615 [Neisseria zoodegmatis]|uniref:Uncharacterized protein n=1 Tax=Neisseria zoodegmatis TaxID=326523 RepID=A0ABX3WFH0_9NEIS|nr:hypothetical protein BWD10_04615 [Neisseria zoodegmatis]
MKDRMQYAFVSEKIFRRPELNKPSFILNISSKNIPFSKTNRYAKRIVKTVVAIAKKRKSIEASAITD